VRGGQLRRGDVDADDAPRAVALQPGAEEGRAAAELDDVETAEVGQRVQLGFGHSEDAPGDLTRSPVGTGA
jgi:hypothetical protein